LTMNFSG